MNFDSHLQNALDSNNQFNSLTPEDIVALSHYPSLDKLFQDSDLTALNAMKNKLQMTFQSLERVILRGSGEDAKRAQISAAALKNALDFLTTLEQTWRNKTSS